jgi:hydroxymethylbilane synthase
MQKQVVNIGTRSSRLAMWQALEVQYALERNYPGLTVNIVTRQTLGDKVLDKALSKIGDKGLFTKEIESGLEDGSIDVAVHSLKDLPTTLPGGLIFGGVLSRGEVRDIFISRDGRKLHEFTHEDRIGTSSLRRQAQLLHFNPKLKIVDVRGNVESRLRKMEEGHCDGVVLAGAGVERLGLGNRITEYLDPEIMLPAVSQGAVAMQIRDQDAEMSELIQSITDSLDMHAVRVERRFLKTVEGGCQVPVACYTEMSENEIKITGLIASVDGRILLRKSVSCEPGMAIEEAELLAKTLLEMGGRDILKAIR